MEVGWSSGSEMTGRWELAGLLRRVTGGVEDDGVGRGVAFAWASSCSTRRMSRITCSLRTAFSSPESEPLSRDEEMERAGEGERFLFDSDRDPEGGAVFDEEGA
jgi:hypothetical protein